MKHFPLLLGAILISAHGVAAVGAVIWVDANNTLGPWDGSDTHPYQTIQDGINAAQVRDIVRVRDGVYSGLGNVNVDFGGKGIVVESANGPSACVIDCGGVMYRRGFIFQSGESSGCVIDGFTVQNGAHDLGGAIHCKAGSSPTIRNCCLAGNEAIRGGAISCLDGSNPSIQDNLMSANVATWGGAVYCSAASPTLTGNSVQENQAEEGGGLFFIAGSAPTVRGNNIWTNLAVYNGGGVLCSASSPLIESNVISANSGDWQGGGIACVDSVSPAIRHNRIEWNTDATWGGGIYIYRSSPEIIGNWIQGNTGGNGGGGIYLADCTGSAVMLRVNTITGNTGGDGAGVSCYASTSVVIDQNRITQNSASNTGGGIWVYKNSRPDITQNTLSANSAAKNGGGIYCSGSSPLISGNVLRDNTAVKKGGGIYCLTSGPRIVGNTIEQGSAEHAAGIFCLNSDPEIRNNIIRDNAAIQAAGGIQLDQSSPEILGNVIEGNSCAAYGGSAIVCGLSSPLIANNLIVGNTDNAFEGGTVYCAVSSAPRLFNNTIVGNSVRWGGSGIYCSDASVTVGNTILWNSSAPEIYFDDFGGPSFISIANSDVKGGQTSGIDLNNNGSMAWFYSNLDAPPQFVDAAQGNYRLALGSPCLGAGAMLTDVPTFDLEGKPRPNPIGSWPDIGAYERSWSGLPDILVNPLGWDFGDVALGDVSDITLTVSNTGSDTLNVASTSLTGNSAFSVEAGAGAVSVEPGASHSILVRFAPAVEGAQSANLELVHDVPGKSPWAISLDGNGVSTAVLAIEVDPLAWDYGQVGLGERADLFIVIRNAGSGALEVTSVSLAGDPEFSIELGGGAFTLNPGEVRELQVRFAPLAEVESTVVLSVANTAGDPIEVQLRGAGVAQAAPGIEMAPELLDFGEVEVGLQEVRSVHVFNPGNGSLEVSETRLEGADDFQIVAGGGPFTLGPGGEGEMLISFAPGFEGPRAATLVLLHNVNEGGQSQIALQGHGLVASRPDIFAEPFACDFGEVGTEGEAFRVVTVFNPGNALLGVGAIDLEGSVGFTVADGGEPFELPPGEEHQITVRFQPAGEGVYNASLVLRNNAGGKDPLEILLVGIGITHLQPRISVNPPAWDYGEVEMGSASDLLLAVTNTGTAVLEIGEMVIEGDAAFAIQDGGAPLLLEPGAIQEIRVRFMPLSIGLKEANLLLLNNVEGQGPCVVSLVGSGVPPAAINHPPEEIALSSSFVWEAQPAMFPVGTWTTIDPDPGDTFTYALVAGPGDVGNSSFAIEGEILLAAGPLDYEIQGHYSIRVRSTDASGLSVERVFELSVVDLDETPPWLSLRAVEGGTLVLSWEGVPRLTYRVQYCDRLGEDWITESGPFEVNPDQTEMSYPVYFSEERNTRFYRVLIDIP